MNTSALLKADFKNIRRDPMLMMAGAAPLIIIALLLFGFPLLNSLLLSRLAFNLTPYFPFAAVFLLHVIPMLIGMIYGFILLDERDEGLLAFYAVTPLGKNGYLKMRMAAPVVFSFIVLLLFIWITNFDHGLIWLKHIPLALITSLQAPMMLLFLAAYAGNKVEGMAITKGFGVLMMAIPIDFFIPSNWTFFAGVSPLFWTARGFLTQDFRSIFFYIVAAFLLHVLFLFLLAKKFNQIEK